MSSPAPQRRAFSPVTALTLAAIFLAFSPAYPQLSGVNRNAPHSPGPALKQAQASGARVAWMSGVTPLGDQMRQNDFPAAASDAEGNVWVVWTSYSGLREEIHARRFSQGTWYAAFPIPGVSGDVWRPQVAVDSQGSPCFVWSQQVNYGYTRVEEANWDLHSACLANDEWTRRQRLTAHPLPDIHHRLVGDPQGRLWLVWQGFRDGQSDIFLRTLEDGEWTPEQRITNHPANDWEPDIAVDSAGEPTVVWDTYRNGNYDVYLRARHNGEWGDETPLAATATAEARGSITFDRQDRLWAAFEDMGANWGKDSGGQTLSIRPNGVRLGEQRIVRVRVREGGAWKQPAADPAKFLYAEAGLMQSPRLQADSDGRVWLFFRRRRFMEQSFSHAWPIDTDQMAVTRSNKPYWSSYATFYQGDHWSPPTELPRSRSRISSVMAAAATPEGQTWVFWNTDDRDDSQITVPGNNQVWAALFTPAIPYPPARLVPTEDYEPADISDGHRDELGDLARLRGHRVDIAGREHRIYRGDLHRHTELSADSGGATDGSVLDFFRYMIDAAGMDFGAITDHSAGADNEYWWWLTQKVTEMHQAPGRYLSLFGNERTAVFPHGHRNIIHPYRNVPIVKFHFRGDVPEAWNAIEAGARDLVENDTKLLYESLEASGGIAISHTSGTQMGTDWRDNNPDVEPVVEIYQGARYSFEHEGAPATDVPGRQESLYHDRGLIGFRGAYQPAGFVWKAWEKGYRLGVIASSDHNSTHLSYALAYAPEGTRKGVIEAIRDRRTYAATDNILLEFWMGDHFMGDDVRADSLPELRVKVIGTAPIKKISLIRNQQYIDEREPSSREASYTFRDNQPLTGSSFYYIRVEQTDGQMAWASPIWITLP